METVSVWEDGKLLEMAAGGGCTSMWVCLLPLNCVLKEVEMVNSPQLKKIKVKKV